MGRTPGGRSIVGISSTLHDGSSGLHLIAENHDGCFEFPFSGAPGVTPEQKRDWINSRLDLAGIRGARVEVRADRRSDAFDVLT